MLLEEEALRVEEGLLFWASCRSGFHLPTSCFTCFLCLPPSGGSATRYPLRVIRHLRRGDFFLPRELLKS